MKLISLYVVFICFTLSSAAQSIPVKESPFPDRFSELDGLENLCSIFPDHFDDNRNGWDLFTDEKSSAKIENGRFTLESMQNQGASRIIKVPELALDYSFEVKMDFSKMKAWAKAGLIFGFKDWENYQFFVISSDRISIGKMVDGVLLLNRDDFYSVDIRKKEVNTLKVLTVEGNIYFALNGRVQLTVPQITVAGDGFGVVVSRHSGEVYFDDFIYKVMKKKNLDPNMAHGQDVWGKMTGLGLIFTVDGFILTSYNVIRDAQSIAVEVMKNRVPQTYKSKLVFSDQENDLALLQIDDSSFVPLDTIPFSFDPNPGVFGPKNVFTVNTRRRINEFDDGLEFYQGSVLKVPEIRKSEMPEFGWRRVQLKQPAPRVHGNKFNTTFNVHTTIPGAPIFDQRGKLVGLMQHSDNSSEFMARGTYMSYIRNMLSNAPVTVRLPISRGNINLLKDSQSRMFSEYVTIIKVK